VDIIKAYSILGVMPPFSPVELLSAYRRQAHIRHPDHGGSETLFLELTEAYQFMKPLAHADVSLPRAAMADGIPLSELGKGYPLTKSACTCDKCNGKGYTQEERYSNASIECVKCLGHGIISYECKKCSGWGQVNERKCNTCQGSGRFFPRMQQQEIDDGFCYGKKPGSRIRVQASCKLPKVHGKICFECDGNGRIPYEANLFRNMMFGRAQANGYLIVQQLMHTANCSEQEAKEKLGFKAMDTVIEYHKCYSCKGIGEIEMWNPVLPRGMLAGR
jgi:hypothetical protein